MKHRNEELAVFELKDGPLLTLVKADCNSRGHFTINGQVEFSIAFTSPNLKQLREHLLKQMVQVDEIQEDNGHYFFHFYDPSGNKLQAHW
ncbi:VOC family protein [Virgibacillus flavescens]|uniref:VOC family protein n=1 Tax=Virgibacillus flavescens TaxID=1611422 RepID=UPI003D3340D5